MSTDVGICLIEVAVDLLDFAVDPLDVAASSSDLISTLWVSSMTYSTEAYLVGNPLD